MMSTQFVAAILLSGCMLAPEDQSSEGKTVTTESGLTIVHTMAGTGARAGDVVWVHYSGKLADGTPFDSSAGDEPIEITLGKGTVIKGWEEGLLGMQVGEKRQLIIPPDLAYGAKGKGPIPPDSTLHFDVELVGLKRR